MFRIMVILALIEQEQRSLSMIREDIRILRDSDIEQQAKDPVLDIFSDHLSWKYLFEKNYYVDIKYLMNKSGDSFVGIKSLCERYYRNKIIITGATGFGKTASLKYLYIKLNKEKKFSFFYVPARIFVDPRNKLTDYEKEIRRIVEENEKLEGLILIDGFEEAFFDNYRRADQLLNTIGKNVNSIWLACRPDFYKKIGLDIDRHFDDIAQIILWGQTDFDQFLSNFANHARYSVISERVQEIIDNSVIEKTSLYCPLYATMMVFVAADNGIEYERIHDEYDLIKSFISLWFERELTGKEQKGIYNKEYYINGLRSIVIDTYKNKGPKIPIDDSVIKGLYFQRKGSGRILGFYHREFLVYFIVDGMINAALNEPDEIIRWYSQTFYDDITNLFKKAVNHLNEDELNQIYRNLFHVYKESYDQRNAVEEELKRIDPKLKRVSILKLRDEILYCIMRLPGIDIEDFLNYAEGNCDYTLLSLGLAYGMANLRQHSLTLRFAQKLKPGTEEDLVQRSWAVCYYGDVYKDGHTYKDDNKTSWEKVKKKKLERLMISSEKAFRYRILDIPLLYCFYASRHFKDCNSYKDYEVIRNCDIAYDGYTEDEKLFVETQKKQLVETYKAHLINKWIEDNPNNRLVQNSDKELDEDMIMKQLDVLESVNNNLNNFWIKQGKSIVNQYRDKRDTPDGKPLNKIKLKDKLEQCRVLILTANYVEGVTVTRCLMEHNDNKKLERIIEDKHIYQFASINNIPIVHIWPQGTSSFTMHGSFRALVAAFKRFTPTYVFAIGVAFGADADHQQLGDVLVSDHLIFYDSFNKRTDGILTLKSDEVQLVGEEILAGCQFLKTKTGPSSRKIGDFKWNLGPMLTGGTVLSDADEKLRLIDATKKIGYEIIGGEMEGSGIYFACSGVEKEIPFIIVKGICDWGVNKNGWNFVTTDKDKQDEIKDCVQAYACVNAFNTVKYILSQIIEKPEE